MFPHSIRTPNPSFRKRVAPSSPFFLPFPRPRSSFRSSRHDPESGPSDGDPDTSICVFFSEAEATLQKMLSIQHLLAQLNRDNEARKSQLSPQVLRSLSVRINGDMVKTVRKARRVRARLQSMDSRVDPRDLERVSVVRSLSAKLKEVLGQFQGLRQRMVEENREAVARCYFTITGEKPSEEVIEGIISSGHQVDSAGQDVNAAKVALEGAKVHQTGTRKTWLWVLLVVLVLIVLAIVAGVVWFSLSNKNSGLRSAARFVFDFVSD